MQKKSQIYFKYLKINKVKNINIDYLTKGYIDSLGFIKFVVSIEKKFKIKFNQKDFINRKFRTIKGLAAIINNKKEK